MTTSPPPPPPSAPPGGKSPTLSGNAPIVIGVLLAAALGFGVYQLFFNEDDSSGLAATTSTIAGSSTTAGATTTSAGGDTTTTAAGATTTTAAGTTTTTAGATTTTAAAGALDTNLPAFYTEEDLFGGFPIDPWDQPMSAGGPVDVQYLGGSCLGFAAEAPDVQITWTGSGNVLLRFYFIADEVGADTVLIINDPSGAWFCNDDSYGTSNPTIDFGPSVPDGVYDIWVGTYFSGTFIPGTLYITELNSNHP